MRFNKLFSPKSITNLLYGFLLLMPFGAILSRVIYTQANPNAKDSYYGVVEYLSSSNYKTYIDAKNLQFQSYTDGQYTNYKVSSTSFNNIELITEIYNFNTTINLYGFNANSVLINGSEYSNIKSFVVGCVGTNWWYVQTYDFVLTDDYFIHRIDSFSFDILYIDISMPYIDKIDVLTSSEVLNVKASLTTNVIRSISQTILDRTVLTYSTFDIFAADNTLSNAFDYAIQSFTADNNLGNVDFFGWFTNLFLNQSNKHNALYLNFANWYMNYALLVSSGYLIFMALIWFINYVRRIMDKSMNHDFGGF